jgi:hypothetical protein
MVWNAFADRFKKPRRSQERRRRDRTAVRERSSWMTGLGGESLEGRALLANASLVGNDLQIDFTFTGSTAEAVTIASDGTNYTLGGDITGTTSFSVASVNKITLSASGNSTAQSMTFQGGTAFTLSQGLASTDVDSVTVSQAINAGGGSAAISIDAPGPIDIAANLTAGSGGVTLNAKGPAAERIWLAPSFSARGPGLIRGTWIEATAPERRRLRARLGADDETFLVMGFGYADAPWASLQRAFDLHGLPPGFQRALLYRPQGLSLTHDEFDLALQACDLNFVRGEDSFVRAHWAAASPWRVPFVWQPYRQEGMSHRDKLEGWLDQIFRPSHAMVHLEALHFAFNVMAETPSVASCWRGMLADWTPMRDHLQDACRGLAEQPALEERLLALMGERTESARIRG